MPAPARAETLAVEAGMALGAIDELRGALRAQAPATGLRSVPMRSIVASATSPGLR